MGEETGVTDEHFAVDAVALVRRRLGKVSELSKEGKDVQICWSASAKQHRPSRLVCFFDVLQVSEVGEESRV